MECYAPVTCMLTQCYASELETQKRKDDELSHYPDHKARGTDQTSSLNLNLRPARE